MIRAAGMFLKTIIRWLMSVAQDMIVFIGLCLCRVGRRKCLLLLQPIFVCPLMVKVRNYFLRRRVGFQLIVHLGI